MPPWITDDVLRKKLADTLETQPDKLGASWTTIIQDANLEAGFNVVDALTLRGYTSAQIDTWDRRKVFQTDLGLYWCYVKGTLLLSNYNVSSLKLLDRREEMMTIRVTAGGQFIAPLGLNPDGSGTAGIGGGSLTAGTAKDPRYLRDLNRGFPYARRPVNDDTDF